MLFVQVVNVVLKQLGHETAGEVIARGSEWITSPLGWSFELVAWQAYRQFAARASLA